MLVDTGVLQNSSVLRARLEFVRLYG
jgi:hypothetical protein